MKVHGVKLRDFVKEPLEVLSFGGGVQSFAILLLIKEGKLPIPDIIIHSDTGSEMPHTHEIVKIGFEISKEMNIPFHIVSSYRGKLHEDYMKTGTLPVVGIRSCTTNFKIFPQRRFIREIVGNKNGKVLANCWLGITTDESKREVKSNLQWIQNKFPLLEINYTRKDCIELNSKYNYSVKKSGCFCCPYAGKNHFVKLYQDHPELFKIVKEMESKYHKTWKTKNEGILPRVSDISTLQIPSLVTFGAEILSNDESSCDSGGCFL